MPKKEEPVTEGSYLRWLVGETRTSWWHDSGDPQELSQGLAHGATGVTTNPVLVYQALHSHPEKWAHVIQSLPGDLSPEDRAEALVRSVVSGAAQMLRAEYERPGGRQGYVCAQVNPTQAADAETMVAGAKRFQAWAPNIAVKLPVTAAGLEALEECAAAGITVAATISFTVPQAVAIAERFERGRVRAQQAGIPPGRCFAVIMIGRLDDYLLEVARDRRSPATESDILQAGLAVTKRAYQLYQERTYQPTLIVAALRGAHHVMGLAGGKLILSVHPKIQSILRQSDVSREPGIDAPIPAEVIRRLMTLPEFVRAYEPEGMAPEEFFTFGLTQRTLTQFSEAGWSLLKSIGAG